MNPVRGMLVLLLAVLPMRAAEISLPRPGTVTVSELTGTLTMVAGETRKPLKAEERVRVGVTLVTGRRSLATLLFSNGATVQLGPETEVELEEFGQAPVTGSVKPAELKEEPTLSRTRIRLERGDVTVNVKPLKLARGSSFHLTTLAGTLRTGEAAFRAMIQMSELGLGICTVDLQSGSTEFEPVGGTYQRIPAGRKLAFAIEQDKATGAVKLGEMPKPPPPPAK